MRPIGQTGGLLASLKTFERARYTRRQKQAEILERLASEVLGPASAAQLALAFSASVPDPDSDRWTFAMISPGQNAAVVEWLSKHSTRPQVAVRLWAMLFTALRSDNGEILLSRNELAQRLGIEPRTVSELMGELSRINAIVRRKEGRSVRYSMNPSIATHIPGPEARKAAREAAGPLLVLMQGGKVEI
jgi:DNA-binding transcriptional ArsR family regulator